MKKEQNVIQCGTCPCQEQARKKKKSRKEIEEECRNIPTVEFPTEVGCDALEEEGLAEFVESRRRYHW